MPVTEQQSKQCESRLLFMAGAFWYAKMIVLIDHLKNAKARTEKYYADFVDDLVKISSDQTQIAKEKHTLHSVQCTRSHNGFRNEKIKEMEIRIVETSFLFARCRLFLTFICSQTLGYFWLKNGVE